MTITVSCRLEQKYVNQLKQISSAHDRTVSRTLRRIVIDTLTRRDATPRPRRPRRASP